MSKWKVIIVDNAAGGMAHEEKWRYVHLDLMESCIDSGAVIYGAQTSSFDTVKFINLSALSKDLSHKLRTDLDENTIILFANARTSLVLELNEYRAISGIDFKLIGFWSEGIFDRDGQYRKKIEKRSYRWAGGYERAISNSLDINLFPLQSLYDKFKKYYNVKDSIKMEVCPLPFTYAIQSMIDEVEMYGYVKDDLVIMNTAPDNIHDLKIFDVWKNRFPSFQFINIYESKLNRLAYLKVLKRAKVVVSTNKTDHSPASIYEAMAFGCIPLMPRIPVYEEMFDNEWLYDSVALKEPYLNYMRHREQIEPKILNYVNNYLSYNIEDEVERVHNKYFDSTKLKEIICNLIAQ